MFILYEVQHVAFSCGSTQFTASGRLRVGDVSMLCGTSFCQGGLPDFISFVVGRSVGRMLVFISCMVARSVARSVRCLYLEAFWSVSRSVGCLYLSNKEVEHISKFGLANAMIDRDAACRFLASWVLHIAFPLRIRMPRRCDAKHVHLNMQTGSHTNRKVFNFNHLNLKEFKAQSLNPKR